jgi:hypothetical protein
MTSPFSNLWFSALATLMALMSCYTNRDRIFDEWSMLFFTTLLVLNTILLVRTKFGCGKKSTISDHNTGTGKDKNRYF